MEKFYIGMEAKRATTKKEKKILRTSCDGDCR